MNIKLIVLDLDQTLLKNNWKIHPKNLIAIKKIYQTNIKVIIATGRGLNSTIKFAKLCLINKNTGYIICYNGGNIINIKNDNELKILYEKSLNKIQLNKIINFANENKLKMWGYSVDNKTAWINKKSWKNKFLGNLNNLTVKKITKNNYDNMYKILLFCKNYKHINNIKNEINKIEKLEFAITSNNVLEINPIGVNKATAVQFLCKKWNINSDEILACGDGMNDYQLIKWVKYGIVMKNGHSDLKKIAFDITSKNTNGGVAKTINKYILSKLNI